MRPRRRLQPRLENLEQRRLLSRAGSVEPPRRPPAHVAADAAKPKKEAEIKRLRNTIYGVLLPSITVTDGKAHGAAIVGGDVVWLLDLTAVKGLPTYARQLVGQPVVAYGTAKIKRDDKGKLKRSFLVNWMEPLQQHNAPLVPPDLGKLTGTSGTPR